MTELEQQVKVSKMLGMAFVLSITGFGGIGSLLALILGLRASRLIQASRGRIGGGVMAWWCIVAGALGTVVFPIIAIAAIFKVRS